MNDIITFGSASWDIFLKPDNFKVLKNRKDFVGGKGICFNMGSKIDVQEFHFFSGGGGTNTAATFVRQGFKTAYCGAVGNDFAGERIIAELLAIGISVKLIKRVDVPTNHSIILSTSDAKEDRTALVFRGASEDLTEKSVLWKKITPCKWFYIAPLSGKLCGIFQTLVDFARNNGIKIAANPGNSQISLPKKKLAAIIKKIDVLILNQEEASLLTGISYKKEKDIFKKIDEMCDGIAVMTKGSAGVVVSDGQSIYSAKNPPSRVADETGAGDAFGSGFISGLIHSNNNIETAIRLGLGNATSCISQWGAKNGLLKRGDNLPQINISQKSL